MKGDKAGRARPKRAKKATWARIASEGMETIRDERAAVRKQSFWLIKVTLLMVAIAAGVVAYHIGVFVGDMRRGNGGGGGLGEKAPINRLMEDPEVKKELRNAMPSPWVEVEEKKEAVEAPTPTPMPREGEDPAASITKEDVAAGRVRERVQALRERGNEKPLLVMPEVW